MATKHVGKSNRKLTLSVIAICALVLMLQPNLSGLNLPELTLLGGGETPSVRPDIEGFEGSPVRPHRAIANEDGSLTLLLVNEGTQEVLVSSVKADVIEPHPASCAPRIVGSTIRPGNILAADISGCTSLSESESLRYSAEVTISFAANQSSGTVSGPIIHDSLVSDLPTLTLDRTLYAVIGVWILYLLFTLGWRRKHPWSPYEYSCGECGAYVWSDSTECPECGALFHGEELDERAVDDADAEKNRNTKM